MKRTNAITLAIVVSAVVGELLVPKAGAQAVAGQELVTIRDVTVIDTRAGRPIAAQTVSVQGGRIVAVTHNRDARIPSNGRVVNGAGKYLLPGFWDMHAHLSNKAASDVDMPQYLAWGITGVRVMQTWTECPAPIAGDACFDDLQEWRRRVLAGELAGPRVLAIPSNLVNGPPPPGAPRRVPTFLNQETADDGRQLARYLKQRGVDFIKIYNSIPRDAYFALLEEAGRIGLPAAGHIPQQVSVIEASEAGQRAVDHIQHVQQDCWSGIDAFRANPAGGHGLARTTCGFSRTPE